jgi:hypothetical protein
MKGIYMTAYNDKTSEIVDKYPFMKYWVEKTSPFFENAYILDLVVNGEHKGNEWFGVLSPQFFTKCCGGRLTIYKMQHDIERGIQVQTGRNQFERHEADAIGYHPSLRNRNMIQQGNLAHGDGFSQLTQDILTKAGVDWDVTKPLKKIVLSNAIITRQHVYEDYVLSVLEPCMTVMDNDEEIRERVWKNSGYHKNKSMSAKLKADLGVNYYPLHTFICERLWSVYLAMNPSVKFRHFGQ